MKRFNRILFFAVLLGLSVTSCSSDDDSSSITGGDFIEFSLDGDQYRIENFGDGRGNMTAILQNLPQFDSYKLVTSHFKVTANVNIGVSFVISDSIPLGARSYIADGSTTGGLLTFPAFAFTENGEPAIRLDASVSSGVITIQHIDAQSGGRVEGTFDFEDLIQTETNGEVLSEGHRLTDGRFRMTID